MCREDYIRRSARRNPLIRAGQMAHLGLVGHGAGIFDKFLEAGHHRGAGKEFAEDFDFAAKLFARNRLDELLCGDARAGVKFCDLRGGGPGQLKCFPFGRKLRHETHRLRASGIDAAARQQEIADEAIAKIALQPRNASETRDESEAQFGESEAGHLVSDDHIADESEFETPAETNSVDGGDGDKRSFVEPVEDGMDVLEKFTDSGAAILFIQRNSSLIELAKISSRRKTAFLRARNNARGGLG